MARRRDSRKGRRVKPSASGPTDIGPVSEGICATTMNSEGISESGDVLSGAGNSTLSARQGTLDEVSNKSTETHS